MNAKEWLVHNKLYGILKKIEGIELKWKVSGKKTRRNWWKVLAGTKQGRPCVIEGEVFPVIEAIRIRMGLPETQSKYIKRSLTPPPPKAAQIRWGGKLKDES